MPNRNLEPYAMDARGSKWILGLKRKFPPKSHYGPASPRHRAASTQQGRLKIANAFPGHYPNLAIKVKSPSADGATIAMNDTKPCLVMFPAFSCDAQSTGPRNRPRPRLQRNS